jgi:putative heme-binding domain-containing protein
MDSDMSFFRLGLATVSLSAALAQTSNPLARDPQAADSGGHLFRSNCSGCHGRTGEGGRAPNLTRTSGGDDPDTALFQTISEGRPGTDMGAYRGRLSDENIWRIVAFLRASGRNAGPVKGDPSRGESLFWGKGKCSNCHAVGARGNHLGPQLDDAGRRNLAYLRESLLDPGAEIAGGFGSVTVVTRDGKTLRGIERALDDFAVVFQDFSGKLYSFDRAALRSVTRDTQSLMPDYQKLLTGAEIDDVVAYLAASIAKEKLQ